jgi:stearoyl-CoA desaturase (delta-9 desaturase)
MASTPLAEIASSPTTPAPTQTPPAAGSESRLSPAQLIVARAMSLFWVFLLPGLGTIGAIVTIVQGRVAPIHIVMFVVGFIVTGLGITIGFHRLLTHRSFETHPVVKAVLLIFGSMAVEGPAISWVANHTKHHAFSDLPGDPHSPKDGLLHAHWGWLFHFTDIEVNRYADHVVNDRVAQFVSKTFIIWVILGYTVPFLIAGWEGLIWGGLFRQFAVQNVTFCVNSVCHRWGARPFKTTDLSRNNWIIGILGLGEGWHNNHHAFPSSAFHGLRWWEFDLSGQIIRGLEKLRIVWNVKRPDPRMIALRLFEPTTTAV